MQDAEEFINKFVRVCRANCLEEPTFSTMLLTCLEEVDAPCIVEGEKVIAFVDGGANNSFNKGLC